MSNMDDCEFFDDFSTPEPGPTVAGGQVVIWSEELIGLIAGELENLATELDNNPNWPFEHLSMNNLQFLQSLDRKAQHLRECAKLLAKIQKGGNENFSLHVDSSLDAIASLLAQRQMPA